MIASIKKFFGPKKVRPTYPCRSTPWHQILPNILPRPKTPLSSSIILIISFAALIVLGGILLMLPAASKTGHFTSPNDAFFMSTSAVCVTGLGVVDVFDHFSLFGQIVMLVLIQIGGFGFMTIATFFLLAFGRRIGLREKIFIGESLGVTRLGGLVKIVSLMTLFTVVVEAAGAGLYYIHFSSVFPAAEAVWRSIFHSVSAFNNCGFDLSGGFQSLIGYQHNPLFLLTTAGLIIVGGISFLVVVDILKKRGKWNGLTLDTKLVLSMTGVLLLAGTVVFLITESGNPNTLGPLSFPAKVLNAFFQSVTARTSGFASINIGSMMNFSLFFLMGLMFIGGASGSTAGGIKVNTFGLLTATIWSSIRGKEQPDAFGRQFVPTQVIKAIALVLISLGFIFVIVFILSITEKTDFIKIMFETFSAFGTVGLTTGITPTLSVLGRILIIITMFVGRLGPITLTLALIQQRPQANYRYPQESVRIG
ncbi:MAG TPA: TrkH family potassium uptake protein [Dehalococcoidales bacterium]|nr:TrkH family potassium uptake protein [Dehalococcoidales bacterium]